MFMVSRIRIPIIRDSCHDHDVYFFEDCDARNDDDDNHNDDGHDYSCFLVLSHYRNDWDLRNQNHWIMMFISALDFDSNNPCPVHII